MDVSDAVKNFFDELAEVWEVIPKPLKVVIYVFTSNMLAFLTKFLTQFEPDNITYALMVGTFNVMIVSVKGVVDRYRAK